MEKTNIKPNEIIFLDYLNGRDENIHISDSWKFDYGIDAQKTINKLINLGYLKFECNLSVNVFKATIPELKQLLKENDLKVTGNKQELAERVLGNIDVDYLSKKFNKKLFCVTSMGKSLIEHNKLYIINKKKNYMFTDKEIQEAYKLDIRYSDNDRLWNIFNNRNISFPHQKKWSSYRTNLFHMGQLLFDENKYEQSLQFYIAVFIMDLSGMEQDSYLQDIDSLFVAPAIIKSIKSLISLCEYNAEHIDKLINEDILCNGLPFNYYSNSTLTQILIDCLNDIPFNFKNYPHNKPIKNSSKYTYYGFYEDNSLNYISSNNNLSNSSPISSKKKGLLSYIINLFK